MRQYHVPADFFTIGVHVADYPQVIRQEVRDGDEVGSHTSAGGAGAVIMLHDGGGNRSQTVAALPLIIRELARRGYHFATVTEALRLPGADVPASGSQRLAGSLLLGIQRGAPITPSPPSPSRSSS